MVASCSNINASQPGKSMLWMLVVLSAALGVAVAMEILLDHHGHERGITNGYQVVAAIQCRCAHSIIADGLKDTPVGQWRQLLDQIVLPVSQHPLTGKDVAVDVWVSVDEDIWRGDPVCREAAVIVVLDRPDIHQRLVYTASYGGILEGPDVSGLPAGWEQRFMRLRTAGVTPRLDASGSQLGPVGTGAGTQSR